MIYEQCQEKKGGNNLSKLKEDEHFPYLKWGHSFLHIQFFKDKEISFNDKSLIYLLL